ncbi:ElyC/SanA/YdcF family protein [Fulvivirgaceae bacterium BMA10]|uniref:ElyC/SanA/YdcF family protein n=1 Tax=Splendidivirga corallicola TaxID=3051826 RepID=A0ABT8KS69_9BACT|nr:ElyC/SanA/YdcF family protein [Fulvivirgaceae bacterium BMA10]
MRSLKKIGRFFFVFVIVLTFFLVGSNIFIVSATKDLLSEDIQELPENKVALVLGTSKKLNNGNPNPYFHYRIDAAANLYHQKKVKHFILSGDNMTKFYNEPIDMKKALMARGVPEAAITLDYAGFRTLDSIVRCKEIFGQDKITIVTQQFHSYRALFIGKYHGMDVVAFGARTLKGNRSLKVTLREFLARPLALVDLYVLNKAPRYLGNKEKVIVAN